MKFDFNKISLISGSILVLSILGCSDKIPAPQTHTNYSGPADSNGAGNDSQSDDASKTADGTAPASTPMAETPTTPVPSPSPTDPAAGDIDPELEKACTLQTAAFSNEEKTGGALFLKYIPDPEATIKKIAYKVCTTLYKNSADVNKVPKVTVKVAAGDGVAFAGGSEVTLIANWVGDISKWDDPNQTRDELIGCLHHEITHLYQYADNTPDWLPEGVADFVRNQAGYNPIEHRVKGGSYTDSYGYPAFFFLYLEGKFPGFVSKLNLASRKWPSDNSPFKTLTGKDLDPLWAEYQDYLATQK